jgi:mannose-6-phosphate isomerase-like protein (cupin superfamily)
MKKYIHGKFSDYKNNHGWITSAYFPEDLINHDKNLEIKVDHYPDSSSFPAHYHTQRKTWTLVLSGCMHMVIEGNNIDIHKGEFVIYEPEVSEQLISTDPDTTAVSLHSPSNKTDDKIEI